MENAKKALGDKALLAVDNWATKTMYRKRPAVSKYRKIWLDVLIIRQMVDPKEGEFLMQSQISLKSIATKNRLRDVAGRFDVPFAHARAHARTRVGREMKVRSVHPKNVPQRPAEAEKPASDKASCLRDVVRDVGATSRKVAPTSRREWQRDPRP